MLGHGQASMRSAVGASWLFFSLSSGCAAAPAPLSEPPREAHEGFVDLAVPGHDPAVVSVPRGASTRKPLLVAAHGAWDRPEPHCELWRRVVGDRAFILCPRGQRTNRHMPHAYAAYYYPDHFSLAREVLAAVEALSARYPDRVDASAAVWAGFSQGAIHGALVIVLHPQLFARAALIEGGNGFFDEWSASSARKYGRAGGERVLFACGSPACVRTADRCAGYLEHAGVDTRVAHAEGAGHSYGPTMEASLHESFAWLVADDARWASDSRTATHSPDSGH